MADVHSPSIRSKNMRAIRNQNTAIEKLLSRILDEAGITYRTQASDLPGKPDFVIDDYKATIFVHGCFWHHHDCYLFKVPATRTEFWLKKIDSNVRRDSDVTRLLTEQGWRELIIWECSLKGRLKLSASALSERIEEWLCASDTHAVIDSKGIHQFNN
ncbi:very short patch repair endonuclease [Serratia inhibens]|uniref:very short patch repair endonuclease n=1 Tax=Serratia inhibens TaxID=2338073 RepID=UPI0008097E5B|nr:DNA mismatch endonuclease Vsr [Serratia inhibens]ANS40983.1 Very short patch repair protein [Serratia inhibens PRI-2C]